MVLLAMTRLRSAALALVLFGGGGPFLGGCGGSDVVPDTVSAPPTSDLPGPPPPKKADDGVPPLPAWSLASTDSAEPHMALARSKQGALLFFESGGKLLARRITASGAPADEAVEVAAAPEASTQVAVTATRDGWLAAWDEVEDRNQILYAVPLDATGKPTADAARVVQVSDEVSWLDVMAHDGGALVVWEVPRASGRDVFAAPITLADARSSGPATTLVRGALGWDLRPSPKGAVLISVQPPAPTKATKGKPTGGKGARGKPTGGEVTLSTRAQHGHVFWSEIDGRGEPGPATQLTTTPTAFPDVALAPVGGRWLAAWTDERELDASLYMAAVEPGGRVAIPARRVLAPLGDQALVSLIAQRDGSSSRALLAWEEVLHHPRSGRLVQVATVFPDLVVAPERAELAFAGTGTPYFEADGEGFAAVTLFPAKLEEGYEIELTRHAGATPPVWPAFVRFGKTLDVVGAQPILADVFADNDGAPELTHALSCGGGECFTLATSEGRPARIAAVGLPPGKTPWLAAGWQKTAGSPPHPKRLTSISDGPRLADLDLTSLTPGGNAGLAAWVTYSLSMGAPKKGEEEASVVVAALSADGSPGEPLVVSSQALSMGGVDLATSPASGEVVLAWVGRRDGVAQLMVTALDSTGKKKAQKAITSAKRDADGVSDVAIAPYGKGWVAAWVDARDGNGEVYVAKLDKHLAKIDKEVRVTEADGDAAEVRVHVAEDTVWLAWSDDRGDPDAGGADIYVVKLDGGTLEKQKEETRVLASSGHSRSPHLVAMDASVMLAWIEEAQGGAAAATATAAGGVYLAELDAEARLVGAPRIVTPERGGITSVALACGAAKAACRGVVTSATQDSLDLGGFQWSAATGVSPITPLANLTGGPGAVSAPAFLDASATALVFADDTPSGTGRVRWMQLAW